MFNLVRLAQTTSGVIPSALDSAMNKILFGIGLTFSLRITLVRLLLVKLRRDVRALGAGDYRPLLRGYAEDAVLHFIDGDHRWSGDHVGRDGIEKFLQSFVAAGLHGEILEAFVRGWRWNMTIVVRFDDVSGLDGERLDSNRPVLMCRTRWGKIVEQEDFYEDTARIEAFDQRLTKLGI